MAKLEPNAHANYSKTLSQRYECRSLREQTLSQRQPMHKPTSEPHANHTLLGHKNFQEYNAAPSNCNFILVIFSQDLKRL